MVLADHSASEHEATDSLNGAGDGWPAGAGRVALHAAVAEAECEEHHEFEGGESML